MNGCPVMLVGEPWLFAAAFLTAVVVSLVFTGLLISVLRSRGFGQRVRDDGPQTHRVKEGTPTMGGLVFILTSSLVLPLFTRIAPEILLVLGVVLGATALGFADDYLKVALRRPLGLRGRNKLLVQMALGALLGWVAVAFLGREPELAVPFLAGSIPLGAVYPLFTALLFTGTTNAVNLTDGLDGLAAGGTCLAVIVFIVAALARDAVGLAVVGVVLLGACMGFLWHNFHPARVIMGDTGSLALGAALAALAVLTQTELLLLLAGGLFVVETISVIVQVTYFRATGGRRLLRMSPLHHHFELLGWGEVGTVVVLWAFQLACVILALFGLRGMGA